MAVSVVSVVVVWVRKDIARKMLVNKNGKANALKSGIQDLHWRLQQGTGLLIWDDLNVSFVDSTSLGRGSSCSDD